MLRFQHIELFWLFIPVGLLAVIYSWRQFQRNKTIRLLGDMNLVQSMMPNFNQGRSIFRFSLLMLALFIGVVGLANLQAGSRSEKINRKGIDVMIALDVSKSMLAKDFAPTRLEKSKQLIGRILDKIKNNRIGLILFAGRAYVSVPLTVDISALKMNLAVANPGMVPTQGTVVGEAIRMARESFNSKDTKYKSIVLITDGEDHDDGVNEEVKQAVAQGISITTVGVGSPEGTTLFDEETGENKKDEQGNDVISKLNEAELKTIAADGQGIYTPLGNTEATADVIAKQINSAEQKNFGDSIFTDYNSYFQYFLVVTFFLILLEFFIPERKKRVLA
ncbi:MAG TPA: VWA domain-containing protein [Chitinophagaceae bacterium]|nr:VWA domain-containing protein [Chitinophagaceae bacterium]